MIYNEKDDIPNGAFDVSQLHESPADSEQYEYKI